MVRTGAAYFRVYNHMLTATRDAWAKHKDLDPYEAKWLYVDALLKVCTCINVMNDCCTYLWVTGSTEVLGQNGGEGLSAGT